MNFELSDEQRMIRDMVSDFAEEVIKPRAIEIDKTGEFTSDIFKKMGELGFMRLPFSEKYGESGGDTVSYILAVEEIGERSSSTDLRYAAEIYLGASTLYYFGTEKQKEIFLKPLINGNALGTFGLTEPNTGSNASGTRTTAVLKKDEYVIN